MFARFLATLTLALISSSASSSPEDLLLELPEQVLLRGVLSGKTTDSIQAKVRIGFTKPVGVDATLRAVPVDINAIAAKQISIPEVKVSSDATFADIDVNIRGVDAPGTYSGKILLELWDPGAKKVLTSGHLGVSVRVGVVPLLQLLPPDQLAFNVSNCSSPCPLTALFAPGTTNSKGAIHVSNKSPVSVQVSLDARVTDSGGRAITSLIRPDVSTIALQPTQESDIGFTILQENLAPDAYHGKIIIKADTTGLEPYASVGPDGNSQLINQRSYPLDLTLNVRSAAIWPLIVVALGVVAGRLAVSINSAPMQAALELYPRYIVLRDKVQAMTDGAAQSFCDNRLKEIYKELVAPGGPDKAKVNGDLSQLDLTVEGFEQFQKLADPSVQRDLDDKTRAQIAAEIESGRQALFKGDLVAAGAAANNIAALIASARTSAGTAPKLALALDALKPASESLIRTLPVSASKSPTTRMKVTRVTANVLAVMAGTGEMPIETAFWFVRPVLYLTTLVAICVYGVWQNYSGLTGAAVTFGSTGIAQYVTLFLWGISSDVVNKTLQTLTFPGKPA